MKSLVLLTVISFFCTLLALSSCAVEQQVATPAKPSAPAAPAMAEAKKAPPAEKLAEVKAKPIKAKGDVGLLDLEKNYMILVTKEGKLITVDFDAKTNVTRIVPTPSKVEDIGLGSSASVEYQSKGDKKIISKIEYKGAKGGE